MKMDLMAADNQLLAVKTGAVDFRSYSATLGFGRRIYRNASMNLFFERLNQAGSIIGLSSGNHNLAGVSISYDFLRPIWREKCLRMYKTLRQPAWVITGALCGVDAGGFCCLCRCAGSWYG